MIEFNITTAITIGATNVNSGTDGRVLIITGGKVGEIAVDTAVTSGSNNLVTSDAVFDAIAAMPAGLNRQIQFNNSGAFGADTNLVYHATGNLSIGNSVDSGFRLDVTGPSVFRGNGNAVFSTSVDGVITTNVNGTINSAVRINANSNYYNESIAIGVPTKLASTNTGSVCIGAGAISNAFSVVIGRHSVAGNVAVAIGEQSSAKGAAVAIGAYSVAPSNYQFVSGGFNADGNDFTITNVYFGSGVQRGGVSQGAGISYTINGSGGFGTDQAGGNITIAGGKPTGSGIAGDVIFATSTAGATGTALRKLTDRWWVKGTTGQLANTATPSASAIVQFDSTARGFAMPRMTATQAEAIATPLEGLLVYATDGSGTVITSKGWWGYEGSTWVKLN